MGSGTQAMIVSSNVTQFVGSRKTKNTWLMAVSAWKWSVVWQNPDQAYKEAIRMLGFTSRLPFQK